MEATAKADGYRRTVAEAARSLGRGELTSVALTESVLARAHETEPRVRAYVSLTADEALAAAARADADRAAGRAHGPLHGIPVSIKDVFDVVGEPTGAGSSVRHDHVAACDADAVARLRDAGAVLCGKVVTHEFAFGAESPPASNPWDSRCIPGGSSGGSAASVAAESSLASLGSDTGCSIRLPAAFCGVTGLKPTFGLVPTRGIEPLSWTCDHVGPIAKTVEDCAIVLEAIAGAQYEQAGFVAALERGVAGLRIGIPREHFFDPCDPGVEACVREAIAVLEREGAEIVDVSLPLVEHSLAAAFVICLVEAAASHRRTLRSRASLYGDYVRTLLEAGSCLLGIDYFDAQRVRTLIARSVRDAFAAHRLDLIATPTAPAPPPMKGQKHISVAGEPQQPVMLTLARNLAVFDLTGQPALSVPCGFTAGLPVGLQLAGRPFDEATVIRAGHAYQRATTWHRTRPPL
jgi:aspartyl-tRNA(Asn)/glutamyl-tRNA(Gln) amidotransferase subunit A